MAQTFSGTATTADTELQTDQGCHELYVKNTGSTALLVSVEGLHGSDYDTIDGGDAEYYRAAGSTPPISVVRVKTAAGTTTYTAGVTMR